MRQFWIIQGQIAINPQSAEFYYNRGYTKTILKEYKEGILDFSKAIEVNPKFALAYFNRGLLYVIIGQKILVV